MKNNYTNKIVTQSLILIVLIFSSSTTLLAWQGCGHYFEQGGAPVKGLAFAVCEFSSQGKHGTMRECNIEFTNEGNHNRYKTKIFKRNSSGMKEQMHASWFWNGIRYGTSLHKSKSGDEILFEIKNNRRQVIYQSGWMSCDS